MSNREFTATRTMLANAFATAGAELLGYMNTAAALAAIPNTDPPRYVVAGTLAMIAKVLPSADAPAAATVLTDERIEAELHLIAAYWEDQARRGCVDAFQCALREAWNVASRAHAGVTAEPADKVQAEPAQAEPDSDDVLGLADTHAKASCENGDRLFDRGGVVQFAVDLVRRYAAPTIVAQVPAAEVRAQALEEAAKACDEIESDRFDAYKGRGKHAPNNPDRADPYMNGKSDGAGECAAAIRSLAHQSTADKASEVRAAEDEQEECWSADEENFSATSLGQLLDENDHLKAGDTVWVGVAQHPKPEQLFNSDWLIENMGEAAYDIAGEHGGEDYPDVTDDQVKELESLVADWIKRTCPPNFWTVKGVRPYVLSVDDFPNDTTPVEASFAAPSTADSANTGALGEKGADK